MPVLSVFFGIIVRMYKENSGKHSKAHIHAEYSGEEIVVSLDGEILESAIPGNRLKLFARLDGNTQGRLGSKLEAAFSGRTIFQN